MDHHDTEQGVVTVPEDPQPLPTRHTVELPLSIHLPDVANFGCQV